TVYLPGTPVPAHADRIEIEEGRESVYAASLSLPGPGSTGTLRGSVVGVWEQLGTWPPSLSAYGADGTLVARVSVAAHGAFSLRLPAPGGYRLQVYWYPEGYWVGGASFQEATPFSVGPDSETVVPPIAEGGLRIRFEDDGLGTHDLRIELLDAGSGRRCRAWYVRTPGDWARMPGIPPGTWHLRVRPYAPGAERWLEQWYDRAGSLQTARTLPTSGGEVTDLTLHLEAGGVIRGRVLGGDYDDWYGAIATPADRDTCWGANGAAEDGSFTILGLPDGAYKLAAGRRLSGCGVPLPAGAAWYGDTVSWDSATVVTIRNHETVEGIEIRVSD
ncbi:MAG: hypothetical protein QUU85_15510, partial [Candidatus Eisenbacteria bacterium]|nr:hypothetical protein [Candidatus Eisenbacteria bacterium]